MTVRGVRLAAAAAAFLVVHSAEGARGAQDGLVADTGFHGPTLTFDWQDIKVGVGAYQEGPTGLTIIRFMLGAAVVVDSRGGAPATVNTDALRLGYATPRMDAIVFSGGAVYGEEAVTAVMTGLKDEGVRSGARDDRARATGAVINDLDGRRLNEIYPDKRLAQAALEALRPGVFPLGAEGAGRMAMQGSFFGCRAHSGQGAAFREINGVKIAAFVVVNAFGSIVDRQGDLVSCHPAPSWGGTPKITELMVNAPASRDPDWRPSDTDRNTTVSLIVTNRKLSYAELERLAIQVHTSMARAIQPFSTFADGDTLFAATTDQAPASAMSAIDLDTMAGEIMWDAILASVPQEPAFAAAPQVTVSEEQLRAYAGFYDFGPHARLKVDEDNGALSVTAMRGNVFEFPIGKPVPVSPISEAEFAVNGRYQTRLSFTLGRDGRVTGATLNPGLWAQVGQRAPDE
ncbi:MAG TPA: P1 family peptidase [Roseiarcus sp.]|nr:P1 family peptidase [Roseiarcus sp.]